MTISGLEAIQVDSLPNLTFVQVHTDTRPSGVREAFYGSDAMATHLQTMAAPELIGQDPAPSRAPVACAHRLRGIRLAGHETRATSAVDLTLRDLLGKAAGLPVYALLGGPVRGDTYVGWCPTLVIAGVVSLGRSARRTRSGSNCARIFEVATEPSCVAQVRSQKCG